MMCTLFLYVLIMELFIAILIRLKSAIHYTLVKKTKNQSIKRSTLHTKQQWARNENKNTEVISAVEK